MIERREIIGGLAAAVVLMATRPALAQALPVIGYLSARSPQDTSHLVAAFHRGLGEGGFAVGRSVAIEYRWALGQYDRLPAFATELVRRPVSIVVTTGGEPAAFAAKAATSTIPIVFVIGGDPVKQGLAASYNRSGGNSTGITLLTNTLEPKRLGLLHELVPQAATIGLLVNPTFPASASQVTDAQAATRSLGLRIQIFGANTDSEIDAAFDTIAREGIRALAVAAGPFFDTRRHKLIELSARHKIPTMYHFREFAADGGLVSYGVDPADVYRQAGVHATRVLKGTNPADLPVLQATKFELVINIRTAKALGLEVSPNLAARADELIE